MDGHTLDELEVSAVCSSAAAVASVALTEARVEDRAAFVSPAVAATDEAVACWYPMRD